MRKNILVVLAVLVLMLWAVEFFIYSVGAIIHTLLIVAVVMLIIRYRQWKKRRKRSYYEDDRL